ncbi:MAG: homoserine dehydrogenase [Clostridiales bacterium]|jgi:homoserine dehydrogenase|nr:homoserine dehydrogenase [Clostridiales bacterium]
MRLAIVGFGGVGRAFVDLLVQKRSYLINEGLDIKVNYVLNSRGGVYSPDGIDCASLIEYSRTSNDLSQYKNGGSEQVNFESIMELKDIDVLVEMTPTNKETGEPGMTHVKRVLENGIHVITSNKGPVMLAYKRLNQLAAENGVQLGIGCTSGGALPTVNGGLIDMAGAEIMSIEGVLNGTTNYILDQMEHEGKTYHEALKKAMEMGIAETDPTLDVEGWDTATKLLILTNILMNEEKTLEDISVEGITGITPEQIIDAKKQGKKYKLVGRTVKRNGALHMSVRPERLDKGHPLHSIDGRYKAVRYVSDTLGDLTLSGGPSGVTPAAASVLRDLINIHRGYRYSR